MRTTGGCAAQQGLTAEAASVVKQAVAIARQRGHTQVTPLHVANSMLAASTGLLRQACLKSHSHPLQCRALELCFNVALNRLPVSSCSSSPMLSHSQMPFISNALVAAFKRAQAHQRRGTIENNQQQQPFLAVKTELDQLIISILDDPSVSRVMKEAGFSSTKVKSNVEQAISVELSSSQTPYTSNEDVTIVIENLMNRRSRKCIVIVGECIERMESVVGGVMDKVDKGDVPEAFREVKFITVPRFPSAYKLSREEVEKKMGELTCLVSSLLAKGVVLYLGDLKWITEYRANYNDDGEEQSESYCYCPVDHMIMELGRLVSNFGENGNFRLMGIATFQTYMRLRNGHRLSLEGVWDLQPVTLPAGGLGLSLIPESDTQGNSINEKDENGFCKQLLEKGEEKQQSCCADCSAEAPNLEMVRCNSESTLSRLPPWLKHERKRSNINDQVISLRMYNPENSDNSNSTSSGDTMEIGCVQRFKEFNAVNLNILCEALEKKVPWQRKIIPDIAGTILQCRSGMIRRKDKQTSGEIKQETWLLFQGEDEHAKEEIAKELGRVVFGSYSNFVQISISSFSSTRSDSSEHTLMRSTKRSRDEQSCRYIAERLAQAVSINPHCVFFIEDVEQADTCNQKGIKRAIATGKITNFNGEEISLSDAIIILSCESLSCRSRRTCSPTVQRRLDGSSKEEGCCRVSLDLNLYFDYDESSMENQLKVDEIGLLESDVDKQVVFRNTTTTVAE